MIVRQRAGIEDRSLFGFGAGSRAVIEEKLRGVADHRLGKRRGEREKHPVPGARGEPRVHAVPHVPGGNDVEHRELLKPAEMIKRKAVADAPAAIMTGETEAGEAERLHHLHHGDRHGALGVGRVVGLCMRHRGPAIARQVGNHQREIWREQRCHAVPHHITLRMAVEEEKRWLAAIADAGKDFSDRRVDPARGVARVKIDEIGHYFASRSTARQPISWRQKPSGQRIRPTAS